MQLREIGDIMMILWIVIIVILLFLLLDGNINFENLHSKSAKSIVDERLVRGEISIADYNELRAIIKEDNE